MRNTIMSRALVVARLLSAVILLQTLVFKFTASVESVYIFSTLGMEPWGRITIGILELIAAVLLLVPATTAYGAVLASALMGGAIYFHLTKLGLSVQGDHGQLFVYALVVFFCSVFVVVTRKMPFLGFTNDKTQTSCKSKIL